MTAPHDLARLQTQWDSEGATIERGKPSFFPERPECEPPMWVGVSAVLMVCALVPFIAAIF